MSETQLPVCFELPSSGRDRQEGDAESSRGSHRLHGADDLISLFGLKPLWERSVKPYGPVSSSALRKMQKGHEAATAERVSGAEGRENGGKADAGNTAAAPAEEAPRVMEKTYVEYVQDLPGKVRPPKRTISKFHSAFTAAHAAGEPPPSLPVEVTGRSTMRDIVFRPETTVQRVGPFDEDTVRAAFTVEAGNVPNIDLSLLEADEVERHSPSKKKKKRKHQRDGGIQGGASEESAAKRSRISLVSGGRSAR